MKILVAITSIDQSYESLNDWYQYSFKTTFCPVQIDILHIFSAFVVFDTSLLQ